MSNTVRLREAIAEAAPLTGNKWRAKIIAADTWGSTAYYPAEVLERDGSRVFHEGLQMYQDHMTDDEKWQRPEGSVANLVGKLVTSAEYEAEGTEGPGLYADVEFYPSYVQRISEIHKDVGLSVRAQGLTEEAERDGRFGPVLVAFLAADSVDVVTRAGAGGKLTSLLESNRELAGRPVETTKEGTSVTDVTKEDFDAFKTELVEAIKAIPGTLVEALKPADAGKEEDKKTAENDDDKKKEDDKVDENGVAVLDPAALAEAIVTNELPAKAAKAVVESVKGGATLEDAIKEQVELREAYRASGTGTGVVTIQESFTANGTDGKPLTGTARAVAVLSGSKK